MMPRLTGPRQRGTSGAKAPAIAVQVRSGFVAPCNRNNATSVSPRMPISGSAPPISAMAWRIVSLEACSVSEGRPATAQQAKSPSKPTSRSTDCARSSTTWFSRHSNATARIRWVALAVSARSAWFRNPYRPCLPPEACPENLGSYQVSLILRCASAGTRVRCGDAGMRIAPECQA